MVVLMILQVAVLCHKYAKKNNRIKIHKQFQSVGSVKKIRYLYFRNDVKLIK